MPAGVGKEAWTRLVLPRTPRPFPPQNARRSHKEADSPWHLRCSKAARMVSSGPLPFIEVPHLAETIRRPLAIALLGGSLLAGSWWVDSLALHGDLRPLIPPYSIVCAVKSNASRAQAQCPQEKPPSKPIPSAEAANF
jgi:hypothetical protein